MNWSCCTIEKEECNWTEWCAITSEKNISCWKNICPPTEYNTHSSAYFILYCCTMQSYIKCVTRVPCIKLYKMYVCAPGMQVCARLHRSHNNQMWFRDPHVQITILQGTTMQSCTGCNTKERHQRRLLLRGEAFLATL